jgi:hypothetical protein
MEGMQNRGMAPQSLERENNAFKRELPRLLETPGNKGKWALIHGDDLAGLYPDFDSCLAAGYERFDLGTFMVKEVTDTPTVHYFPRNVVCRS